MTDSIETPGLSGTPDEPIRSSRGRKILGLVLVALLLVLALAVNLLARLYVVPGGTDEPVDTRGIEWVRSIYGISDAIEDQLEGVQMAVPDSDGSMWITDGVHGTLMHFSASGEFIEALSGPADAPLSAPSRMAVGPDGLLYVCETMAGVIRVLDREGNDAGSFGVPQPVSVAVSEDRIVVGAVSGFAILEKDGRPIKIIGDRGQGDEEFDYVHGVAIAEDETIYVSDSFNNRISAYDPAGTRLWMMRTGSPSNGAELVEGALAAPETADAVLKGADALQLPLGLTIDGAGRIVVIDMFDSSLAVFMPDGTFVGKYGDIGADDGLFFYPTSVSYDPARDWFLVADTLNNRVQVVRLPDSSGGGDVPAAARRALAGPARACLPPFLALLVALFVALIIRAARLRSRAG